MHTPSFYRLSQGELKNGESVQPDAITRSLFTGEKTALLIPDPSSSLVYNTCQNRIDSKLKTVAKDCRRALHIPDFVKTRPYYVPHYHYQFPRGFLVSLSLNAESLRKPSTFLQALKTYVTYLQADQPDWIEKPMQDDALWQAHIRAAAQVLALWRSQKMSHRELVTPSEQDSRLRGQCGEFVLHELLKKFLEEFKADNAGIYLLNADKHRVPDISERFSMHRISHAPHNFTVEDSNRPHNKLTVTEYDATIVIDNRVHPQTILALDITTSPRSLRERKLPKSGHILHEIREDVNTYEADGPSVHHLPIACTTADTCSGYSPTHQIHNLHLPLLPTVFKVAEATTKTLNIHSPASLGLSRR